MFDNLFATLGSLDCQLTALGTKAFVKKEEIASELRYESRMREIERDKKEQRKEEERKAKEKEAEEKAKKAESEVESKEDEKDEVKGESYLEACMRRHADLNLPESTPPLPVASTVKDDEDLPVDELKEKIKALEKETEEYMEEKEKEYKKLLGILAEKGDKEAKEAKEKIEAEEAKMNQQAQSVHQPKVMTQESTINGPDFSKFVEGTDKEKKPVTVEDVNAALETGKKKK